MSCPVDQEVFAVVQGSKLAPTLTFRIGFDILFLLFYTMSRSDSWDETIALPDQIREDMFHPTLFHFSTECEMTMSKDKTVWSSEQGDLRKQKNQAPGIKSLPPQQQTVYLHRESSGRGGKPVTLVKNLVLSMEERKALTKKLKEACGTGGTVKDNVIEIQGEQRQRIAEVLQKMGYKVKIAGG